MDLIDKQIIFELLISYRASYQAIAEKLNLSVNAVKKRFEKLKNVGIIRGGVLVPMPVMKGTEDWLALLRMDEATASDDSLEKIGSHVLVQSGSLLTDGSILCFGFYGGAQDLQEIGAFLRQVQGVKSVEFHTILAPQGKKTDLAKNDLKVLRCLREAPRIPISKITEKTGINSRRVRNILQKLIGENGVEPIYYINWKSQGKTHPNDVSFLVRVHWNLNAGGYTAFMIQIRHKEGVEERKKITDILTDNYSFEFWYAYASAFEPVIFCVFLVEHMRDSIEIVKTVEQIPQAVEVYPIFGYPTKVFRSQVDDYFEGIFENIDQY